MKAEKAIQRAMSLCVMMTLASAVALAADTDAALPESSLSEVVVTAQKTAEPLSRIPISISAVSGATL